MGWQMIILKRQLRLLVAFHFKLIVENPVKFIVHPTKQDLMVKIVYLLEKY